MADTSFGPIPYQKGNYGQYSVVLNKKTIEERQKRNNKLNSNLNKVPTKQNLANKEGFRSGIRRKISFNQYIHPPDLINSLKKKLLARKQKYIDSTKNQSNKISTKLYKTFIESNQGHSVKFIQDMNDIVNDYMTLYPCRKKGTMFNVSKWSWNSNMTHVENDDEVACEKKKVKYYTLFKNDITHALCYEKDGEEIISKSIRDKWSTTRMNEQYNYIGSKLREDLDFKIQTHQRRATYKPPVNSQGGKKPVKKSTTTKKPVKKPVKKTSTKKSTTTKKPTTKKPVKKTTTKKSTTTKKPVKKPVKKTTTKKSTTKK